MPAGDPLQPCPVDVYNGYHDWVAMESPAQTTGAATGNPKPGARYCIACGAMDTGPYGDRITAKDSLLPKFPAGTRSFRSINRHNPDDPSPIAEEGSEVN